jgi:hypothetical protein
MSRPPALSVSTFRTPEPFNRACPGQAAIDHRELRSFVDLNRKAELVPLKCNRAFHIRNAGREPL